MNGLYFFQAVWTKAKPCSIQTTGVVTTFEKTPEYRLTFEEISLAFAIKGLIFGIKLLMPRIDKTRNRKRMIPMIMAGMIRKMVEICAHKVDTALFETVPIISRITTTSTAKRTNPKGNQMDQKGSMAGFRLL